MEYNFREIEKKWQQKWKEEGAYKVSNDSDKPSFYVLDMFPYPSGAGLHVGHPLGYIASDIYSRYKRLKGFNVLHPMGFDSFGLPAEQYALETGQHPAVTTEKNIATFKAQLDKIGFCYDWSREVRTSDPPYYKWTQWIFLQLFNSYFCHTQQKARPIKDLIEKFSTKGNKHFTAEEWNAKTKAEQEEVLMKRRLAFSSYGEVNWCEALGTVLANDEVVNGVSERGGYPVIKKKMRQWYLRITEYADRLLQGLETVNFSDSMKEMQRNWIGKSEGAELRFGISGSELGVTVYTTRPDTIFGVDFLVLAPEHDLVKSITTPEQKAAVEEYLTYVKSRSDRERMAEVKQITGCFTGAYAKNPFNGKPIQVWIAEYVLAGYGTGAIMAVPCGDQRDFGFAKHFNIPITNIIGAVYNGEEANPTKEATLENSDFLNGMLMKDAIGVAVNKIEELGIGKRKVNYRMRDAGFSRQRYWGEPFPIIWEDGVAIAMKETELPLELPYVEKYGPGPEGEGPLANLTDWVSGVTPQGVSRQGVFPQTGKRETSTMPGYAGSSWYFLRYMDPNNDATFCERKASDYWGQVDVYIGGTEHAVGHLLYSRMWTKVLFDLGLVGFDEPFKKLVNQGMIQGSSRFVYRVNGEGVENLLWEILKKEFSEYEFIRGTKIDFVSHKKQIALEIKERLDVDSNDLKKYWSEETKGYLFSLVSNREILELYNRNELIPFLTRIFRDNISYLSLSTPKKAFFASSKMTQLFGENGFDNIHVDVNLVDGLELDTEAFKSWRPDYASAEFILEDGKYICGSEIEKMSKTKYNTVNPDVLVDKYGADTFRMYEMFLGPVEQSKPWDTKGIEGVHRFLRKLWRLFYDDLKGKVWTTDAPNDAELKVLHKTIKKIEQDTENFSYNTAVSAFMVCVNELAELKCNKKGILSQLLILLVPYAPHISEELWHLLENEGSVLDAVYPILESKYLTEASKEYPVSINGKLRTSITIPTEAAQDEAEKAAYENETVQKWLEGKTPKKFIFVKGRMINIVI
jgi:leucyl-tRNA synthetase